MREFRLPDTFKAATEARWREEVDKVLKGADFEKRLVKTTLDGIKIPPLFPANPANSSGIESRSIDPPSDLERPWQVVTSVATGLPQQANAWILDDLAHGAAGVEIKLDPNGIHGVAVASTSDFDRLLSGVVTDLAPIHLDAGFDGPLAADWLGEFAKRAPNAPLAFNLDPLGALAQTGSSPKPIEEHISDAANVGRKWAEPYAKAQLFLASGRGVHEAGGSEGQEIGFALAAALCYAKALMAEGMSLDLAFQRISIGLSADQSPFLTIAKLRAARRLWERITRACGAPSHAILDVRSSRRMLSTLDPWVNLLRLTSAGFGAALGGANSILLEPFTVLTDPTDPMARRQARNIQFVLIEEAHLGKVFDPAAGSGFLDTLTDDLVEAGYATLQALEAEGGIVAALLAGHFQKHLLAVRAKRDDDARSRTRGMVGVSQYPSGVDTLPAASSLTRSTKVPEESGLALRYWRPAEAFEQLRHQAASLPKPPKVALVTLGDAKSAAPRRDYVQQALPLWGLAPIDLEFSRLDKEIALVVLCGSDEDYRSLGPEAVRRAKSTSASLVLIAGRPTEDLVQAGTDEFLYVGCNFIELGSRILERLA